MIRIRPSDGIAQAVAKKHGIDPKAFKTWNKTVKIVRARQEFWFELVFGMGYSLPKAAAVTGHDHTSTLHGVRMFAAREFNTPAKAGLDEIRAAWMASDAQCLAEQAGEYVQPFAIRYGQHVTDGIQREAAAN